MPIGLLLLHIGLTALALGVGIGTLISVIYIGRKIMSSEQDLKSSIDTLASEVDQAITFMASQATALADLQAQVRAGTPVSQDQLDGLVAEVNAARDKLAAALATPPAAPAAPPAATSPASTEPPAPATTEPPAGGTTEPPATT